MTHDARRSAVGRGSDLTSRIRFRLAIGVAWLASRLSRAIGYHGTSLPGLVGERIDPAILARLAGDLDPIVIVLGTNGKTTTTRLLARILQAELGKPPVTNRSGANLRQGLISAILESRTAPRHRRPSRAAVFEVDELAWTGIAPSLRPAVVVILNLVRDQLDRYGEIDMVERRWTHDLAALPLETTLVICADDPRLESLAQRSGRPVRRFGMAASSANATESPAGGAASADGSPCPECGGPVEFAAGSGTWLGPWTCGSCGTSRHAPDLVVGADGTDPEGWLRLNFDVAGAPSNRPASPAVRVRLAGSAGVYDAAAAVLAATALGIDPSRAIAAIDRATPAFGRLEEIDVDGRRVILTLAKNPASLEQAAAASAVRRADGLLIGLGDRPAEGRDISWIWDADLESFPRGPSLTLTGSRADDLALRFKYGWDSGAEPGPGRPRAYVVDGAIDHALETSLRNVRPGGTLVIVATYATLLGIRGLLERRGVATALPR
jgi:UDP-N-acetylmuramyl tripeptide synthase